jgi:hypothetical protein
VPLHEAADFDENGRQLHGQLLKTIRSAAFAEEGEEGEHASAARASSTEAVEELGRLREAQAASSQSTASAVLADPAQPAMIPAGVPKLPARFQPTEQIRELTRLVLSTATRDLNLLCVSNANIRITVHSALRTTTPYCANVRWVSIIANVPVLHSDGVPGASVPGILPVYK